MTIGEETVFRVHVFNKGDAPCAGVRLTAVLPRAVTPLEAKGPSAGQVEKQQVSFAPLAQLDAHGDVVYRIRVRGRQTGKGALRVELTAEKQAPAHSEISIQVHERPTNSVTAVSATKKTGETPVSPGQKTGETPVPPAGKTTAGNTKSASSETLR